MIRVGPAGWSYADWEGRVYPRRKPRGFHPLAHLARYFDLVELNASFYALPDPRHAARWVELVEERPTFRFSAKLHQGFTHGPEPEGAQRAELLAGFRAGLAPLVRAKRLWAVLVQFPVSYRRTPANHARLERLADELDLAPLVVEVRHASWFEPAALRALEALGVSVATLDLPAAPDHPPPDVPQTGPLGYLRVHGRNSAAWFARDAGRDQRYDYLYPPEEVSALARVARRLATGADETAVVTNNHFSGKAVANALELLAALEGRPPLAPVELVEAFPRLRASVRVQGQGSLF